MRLIPAAAALTLSLLLAACAPEGPTEATVARQIVFTSPGPVTPFAGLVEELGYVVLETHEFAQSGGMLVLERPEGKSLPEAVSELQALDPGIIAEQNQIYRVQAGEG